MNLTRIVVFCVALVAAGAAVLLVRGMTGGGTPVAQASLPPPQLTADVLVASKDIAAGRILEPGSVRWESWPKSSVSDTLILKSAEPDIEKAVAGIVVRAPFVAGQPITETSIVRAGSAGFLAATITPGMRAISIPISAESGAGGFILPNDRVDIILARDVTGNGGRKNMQAGTILRDVRVLAIDQTAQQGKDQLSAVGKTATVELSPRQAELIQRARGMGQLSLALRPLGESNDDVALTGAGFGDEGAATGITVIRYGVARNNAVVEERTPQ
jgi:pilus assembly protein CpaB